MKRDALFGEEVIELEILEFKAGGNSYGIEISDINEILNYEESCTSIPNSHPYIEGMVMPRGFVIPVVSVTKALNLLRDNDDNNISGKDDKSEEFDILENTNMLIVTSINDMNIGLLVDSVEAIRRITNKELRKPGKKISTSVKDAVLGVFEDDNKEIELIECRYIFSKINPNIEFVG